MTRFGLAVLGSLLLGCSGGSERTTATTGGVSTCVPGRSIQCFCNDGQAGAQECAPDGTYAACSCATSPGAADAITGGTTQKDTADPVVEPGPDVVQDEDVAAPPEDVADGGVEDVEDTSPEEPDVPLPPVDTGPPIQWTCDEPVFPWAASKMTSLSLPPAPSDYLCDANGDGGLDAADGHLNAMAASLKTAGIDLDGTIQAIIEAGVLVVLFEHYEADGDDYAIHVLRGPLGQTACGADCTWTVAPPGIDPQTCAREWRMPGAGVTAGFLSAGPGVAGVPVPVSSGAWIDLTVEQARIAGVVSQDVDIEAGRLCGTFDRTAFLLAITDLCAQDETPSICSYQAALPDVLTCADEVCTVSFGFEAQTAAGLEKGF